MLDDLDLTLLHEPEGDGVQMRASLGRKVHAAEATIRRREHRLLNRHAVRLLGLPNLSVLGCDLVASKGVNVDFSYWQGILAEFIADSRVRYLACCTGRYELRSSNTFGLLKLTTVALFGRHSARESGDRHDLASQRQLEPLPCWASKPWVRVDCQWR